MPRFCTGCYDAPAVTHSDLCGDCRDAPGRVEDTRQGELAVEQPWVRDFIDALWFTDEPRTERDLQGH